MLIHKLVSIALLGLAATAAAQGRMCPTGPGAAAGILAYSCDHCEFKTENGRTTYTFYTEPVVTQVTPIDAPIYIVDGERVSSAAVVAVGDVIESVNGQPITTRAGADEFTYPSKEWFTLTVRRVRESKTVKVAIGARCRYRAAPDSGFGARARGGMGSGFGGQRRLAGFDSISGRGFGGMFQRLTGDSVVSRFGFAVECSPSCTMHRTPDGTFDFKYDGLPRIAQVRGGSVADKTGLRVGDLIVRVEGQSITEDGVLQKAARRDNLRMTIRRDGKDMEVNMVATKS